MSGMKTITPSNNKKCPHCRNEYKYLKYDIFCPVCLRAIPELIYQQYETKKSRKENRAS